MVTLRPSSTDESGSVMPHQTKPYRAIVVAEKCWVTARVMSAWMAAGNEIAEVWAADSSPRDFARRAALIGWLRPQWDTGTIVTRHAIPVRQCERLTRWGAGAVERARELGADTLLTVMTHLIVPPVLLAHFGRRAVNVHPALLPHYRGAHPRMGMLVDGKADEYGGVTAHVLSERIDEGEIIGQRHVPFSAAGGDYLTWDAMQAEAAAQIMSNEVAEFLDGRREAMPQEAGAGSYRKIARDEFYVTRDKTLEPVNRLCELTGRAGLLKVAKGEPLPTGPAYWVTCVDRVLGSPTGEAPRVTKGYVEMDLADGRVRLKRRGMIERVRLILHRLRAIGRAREMICR